MYPIGHVYRVVYMYISAVNHSAASVIFSSPEAMNDKMVAAMKNDRRRICLVAFDEVHCLSEW